MVSRKTDKGLWKSELWAKRGFEPLEIHLAPFSSQIKDTHLMATAHAVVTIPKHGRGAQSYQWTLGPGRSQSEPDCPERSCGQGGTSWLLVLGDNENQRDEGGEPGAGQRHLVAEHQDEPACS